MHNPIRAIADNRLVIEAMIERNIAGRYRNSKLGLLWNIIAPVILIVVIYVTFTSIKTFHIEGQFWIYLASGTFAMSTCGYCIRGRAFFNNANYVKKMAIPRWVEIIADVCSQFIPMVISYVLLVIVLILCGHSLHPSIILFLPLEILYLFIMCIGCSLIISTLSVVVNDIGHFMSIMSRMILWVTPVFFFSYDANELLSTIIKYNPFSYFVETFHDILYYGIVPGMNFFLMSLVISLVALAIGWIVFSFYEKKLAEML